MKLKFELVNGYGVLVDEDAEIKDGDWFFLDMTDNNLPNELHQMGPNKKSKTGGINFYHNTAWTNCCSKIIFAEPKLKLEGVPVFEWRDFEVEKLAEEEIPYSSSTTLLVQRMRFVQGYKSNPAKYTEEDLRKAMNMMMQGSIVDDEYYPLFTEDQIIQSLQKHPKYVVMESELVDSENYGSGEIFHNNRIEEFTLFTNSERKQQGTVKELIWA